MLTLQSLRHGVRPVAFQAKRVDVLHSQQMLVVVAMRVMAGPATISECRTVQDLFGLQHFRLLRMAGQANLHAICLRQPGSLAGMRRMASGAVTRCSRML